MHLESDEIFTGSEKIFTDLVCQHMESGTFSGNTLTKLTVTDILLKSIFFSIYNGNITINHSLPLGKPSWEVKL